jgi:hypothetical protein
MNAGFNPNARIKEILIACMLLTLVPAWISGCARPGREANGLKAETVVEVIYIEDRSSVSDKPFFPLLLKPENVSSERALNSVRRLSRLTPVVFTFSRTEFTELTSGINPPLFAMQEDKGGDFGSFFVEVLTPQRRTAKTISRPDLLSLLGSVPEGLLMQHPDLRSQIAELKLRLDNR